MKAFIVLLTLVLYLFSLISLAQDPDRIWLTDKISVPAERGGCPWVSSSVWKREKPKDLAGFIVYGFRELFGTNIVYTAHYDCPPKIEEINLSKTTIYINPLNNENKSQKIEISVKYSDPEGDVVVYEYDVSGGKIIGVGGNVVWDLSGVKPNKYILTICVNDGLGCDIKGGGNKKIIEVQVLECNDCER